MDANRVTRKKEKLKAKGEDAIKSGDQAKAKRMRERYDRKDNRLSKNTPASKGRTPGGIVDAKAKGRSESFSDKPKAGEMAKKQEYKPAAKKPSAPAKKTKPVAQKPKPVAQKPKSLADMSYSELKAKIQLEAARATVLKSGKK